jgi:hypothetical protein
MNKAQRAGLSPRRNKKTQGGSGLKTGRSHARYHNKHCTLPRLRQVNAVCAIISPARRLVRFTDIRMQSMRPCSYGRGRGRSFGNGRAAHTEVTARAKKAQHCRSLAYVGFTRKADITRTYARQAPKADMEVDRFATVLREYSTHVIYFALTIRAQSTRAWTRTPHAHIAPSAATTCGPHDRPQMLSCKRYDGRSIAKSAESFYLFRSAPQFWK